MEKDAHSVNLTVALQGESNLPVSVEISATLRSLSGSITENSSETGLNFSLSQSKLEWAPGENEPKLVQIILEGDLTILSSGGIIVGLNASENADISELKTTSIVSRMPRQDLMVGFEFEPDQVYHCVTIVLIFQVEHAQGNHCFKSHVSFCMLSVILAARYLLGLSFKS